MATSNVTFLYAPVGWQHENMGRTLYERGGTFRKVVDDVAKEMSSSLPLELVSVMYPSADGGSKIFGDLIDTAHFAQPALFAVEVALDALWRSRGVIPGAVLGHSLGEFSAACSGNGGLALGAAHGASIAEELAECGDDDEEDRERVLACINDRRANAGPMTRREASLCVAARASIMAQTASVGCMMAVRCSEKECSSAIEAVASADGDRAGVVAIAAVNAPQSTVLSGDFIALTKVIAELERGASAAGAGAAWKSTSRASNKTKVVPTAPAAAKTLATRVRATHADHSPRMAPVAVLLAARVDAVAAEGAAERAFVAGRSTRLLFASTVTAALVNEATLRSGAHWAKHAVQAVRFTDSIKLLAAKGQRVFVEFGEGMLLGFGKETLAHAPDEMRGVEWAPSLARREGDDGKAFTTALADTRGWLSPAGSSRRLSSSSSSSPAARSSRKMPIAISSSAILDADAAALASTVQIKLQPPPHVLRENYGKKLLKPTAQTFTVAMPREASFAHFVAYLELQYGMRVTLTDALAAGDANRGGGAAVAPLRDEASFDAALALAYEKKLGAAYFVVEADLHPATKKPMPPRDAVADGPRCAEMTTRNAATKRERQDADHAFSADNDNGDNNTTRYSAGMPSAGFLEECVAAEALKGRAERAARDRADVEWWASASETDKASRTEVAAKKWYDSLPEAGRQDLMPGFDELVDGNTGVLRELLGPYDPLTGRTVLKNGYTCPEFEPFPARDQGNHGHRRERHSDGDAAAAAAIDVLRRELVATMPAPSTLPEKDFPSDSMGGRCLDRWRYRWGQRASDVWLFVPLPPNATTADVEVRFNTLRLGISICGVPLYDTAIWNTRFTEGTDADTAAWVIVHHGDQAVLQIELHKKKACWWKAVWHDHPTIEPWEVPFWKDATFNDGYHRLTNSAAR